MPGDAIHPRTLGQKDIVLFTVSAILLLDTLAAGAGIGASSVFWWLFLGVVFFVPYALICAELGTTYPEQGGVYAWVRRAFGQRWASRATWAYWVNTAVWIPAGFILFAGIFRQMFFPELTLPAQIALGVTLTWIAVAVNVVSLGVGKWIPNLGAVIKIAVIGSIIGGAIVHTTRHGMANPLTVDTLLPSLDSSYEYLSVIIYGMLGFELASAGSDEMKDPARDVPKAILVSGLIIIALYTSATIAILAAIPAAEIDLVEGLMDTLYRLLGTSGAGGALALLLGVGALYTFFSNGVTWSLGCNRAMAEAAGDGEFPRALGREHPRFGTPVGAAVAMGIVSTTVLLLYGGISGTNADLFWSLFAFSAVIFLIPYVLLVLSFARLRRTDAERQRPYRVPGGDLVAQLFGFVCAAILLCALILFVYVPGDGVQWPVFSGAVVVLLLGEVVIRATELHGGAPATEEAG